jgi:hypothetical protein
MAAILVAAALLAVLLAPGSARGAAPTAVVATSTAPGGAAGAIPNGAAQVGAPPELTEETATRAVLDDPRARSWLRRYPPRPTTAATYDGGSRSWKVNVWSGRAGQIASGVVDDATGLVLRVRTGPQVAWGMAQGKRGQFGGNVLLRWPVWVALSAVFLLGLGDLRRPLAMRNLDLLALLSFGVSLAFYNDAKIFQSSALAAVPLAYLALRCAWIGARGRAVWPPLRHVPVWVLVVATVFLVGFRMGMNLSGPTTVIDVGYAGVIGADRILDGQAPYGHMPVEGSLPACGEPDSEGRTRDRIQTNGRCESSNANGDTYGPVAYAAYVPFVAALGWSGRWDRLWAAHAASIAFDLLALAGLLVAGLRLAGLRLGVTLAFGWAAYPFTAYALNANTNDALMPALLVWGFAFVASPVARGAAVAAAGMAKFAALVLAPLWLTYRARSRSAIARYVAALAVVVLASLSVLLLEPDVGAAARTMWDRTIDFQLGRDSPFSPWDWGQYHAAGIPDLHLVQLVLQALLLAGAGAVVFLPREKGPLELAGLTAALLAGFQLVLTHWFYLYLPWILPFVLLALLLPSNRPGTAAPAGDDMRPVATPDPQAPS